MANDDDDDMTILMCAQKLIDASLIYRTEPKTKNRKEKYSMNNNGYRICSEEAVPGRKPRSKSASPEGGKGRLGWKGSAAEQIGLSME